MSCSSCASRWRTPYKTQEKQAATQFLQTQKKHAKNTPKTWPRIFANPRQETKHKLISSHVANRGWRLSQTYVSLALSPPPALATILIFWIPPLSALWQVIPWGQDTLMVAFEELEGALLACCLGVSWGSLGVSWGSTGLSWSFVGLSWGFLGPSWGPLRLSWALLGLSWVLWGLSWALFWMSLCSAFWDPGAQARQPRSQRRTQIWCLRLAFRTQEPRPGSPVQGPT